LFYGLPITVSVVYTVYGTVTVQEAVCPLSVVAVITAVPDEIAFTLPFAVTVAIAGLLLFHVIILKSVFFGAIVAFSEAVFPTFTINAALLIFTPVG
jgi:hypothetical protein